MRVWRVCAGIEAAKARRRLVVLGLCILMLLPGLPIRGAEVEYPRHFRRFLAGDGLAGESVRSIVKTSDGAVWFACWARGISRYDGYDWTTFQIPSGLPTIDVRVLFLDRDKHLWCGTTEGITWFDGARWNLISTGLEGLEAPSVMEISQLSTGDLWFVLNEGKILQFRPRPLRTVVPSSPINSRPPEGTWSVVYQGELTQDDYVVGRILPLDQGQAWVAIGGLGIAAYREGVWKVLWDQAEERTYPLWMARTADGTCWSASGRSLVRYAGGRRTVIPCTATITALEAGVDDRLYVGTEEGIMLYEHSHWGRLDPGRADNPTLPYVLKSEGDHELWIGTRYGAFRATEYAWTPCNPHVDEAPARIVSLHTDAMQTPLCLDMAGRIFRWDGSHWRTIVELGLRRQESRSMSKPWNGRCWVLCGDRVSEVDLDGGRIVRTIKAPSDSHLRHVYQAASQRLYLYGGYHVYELDGERWDPIRSYPASKALAFLEDPAGDLWVIWSDGLERRVNGVWQVMAQEAESTILRGVESMAIDHDKSLLLGVAGEGVFSYRNGAVDRLCSLEGAWDMQSSVVYRAKDGVVWSGNRPSGIASYRDGLWVFFNEERGLPNGRITALVEGADEAIWALVSDTGVYHYRRREEYPKVVIEHGPTTVASRDRALFEFSARDK